jgi:hypothetical protein
LDHENVCDNSTATATTTTHTAQQAHTRDDEEETDDFIAGAVFLLRLARRAFRALRQHWQQRALLVKSFKTWRRHLWSLRRMKENNLHALQFWSSRLVRRCFALWQRSWATLQLRHVVVVRKELAQAYQSRRRRHNRDDGSLVPSEFCNLCQAHHDPHTSL